MQETTSTAGGLLSSLENEYALVGVDSKLHVSLTSSPELKHKDTSNRIITLL